MPPRKKSYNAASNKGKLFNVFVHNWLVDREKERDDKKTKLENEKKIKNAERLKKIKSKSERLKKIQIETAKEEKKLLADLEKTQKFLVRAEIECQKAGLDPESYKLVAREAIQAGVSVNQIGSVIIKNREQYWRDKTDEKKKQTYIGNVHKTLNLFINEKKIFSRFKDEVISEILSEQIEIESIPFSEIIEKYTLKSRNLLQDLEKRMKEHLETTLY